MEILFVTRKVQKICNSKREMQAKLGTRNAKVLRQRLAKLKAADSLEDIPRIRPDRCHELGQDRKGQIAVDLVGPNRLIFEPGHDPVPKKDDGGLDWSRVTSIVVVEVGDYH